MNGIPYGINEKNKLEYVKNKICGQVLSEATNGHYEKSAAKWIVRYRK